MTNAQPEPIEPQKDASPPTELDAEPRPADDTTSPRAPGGWNIGNRPFVVAAGAAVALAVALLVTVLVQTGAFAAGRDVDVTFTLTDSDLGESCQGSGGYSDIGSGTPVRLTDGGGQLLGATSLGDGAYFGGGCLWAVTIPDVGDADFFSVEVADRGEISKSAAELEAEDWTFGVSLG